MRSLSRTAALLVIGVVLAGCIASSTHTTRSNRGQMAEVGKMAQDIRGIDADGQPFQLSDYRGKVVLLDFWASW